LIRSRTEVERILNETRTRASAWRSVRAGVRRDQPCHPGSLQGAGLATVSVRYAATAVPLRNRVDHFLPKMRDAVTKIEREFGSA